MLCYSLLIFVYNVNRVWVNSAKGFPETDTQYLVFGRWDLTCALGSGSDELSSGLMLSLQVKYCFLTSFVDSF